MPSTGDTASEDDASPPLQLPKRRLREQPDTSSRGRSARAASIDLGAVSARSGTSEADQTDDAAAVDDFLEDDPLASPVAHSTASDDVHDLARLGPVLPNDIRRERRPVDLTPANREYDSSDEDGEAEESRYRPLVFRRSDHASDQEEVPRVQAKYAERRRPLWNTPQTAFSDLRTRERRPLLRRPVTAYRERIAVDFFDLEPPPKRPRLAAPGHRASHAKTPRRDGAGLVDVFSGLAPAQSYPRIVARAETTAAVKRARRPKPGRRPPPVLDFGIRRRAPVVLPSSDGDDTPVRAPRPARPVPKFSFGGGRRKTQAVQQATPPEEEHVPGYEPDIDWDAPGPIEPISPRAPALADDGDDDRGGLDARGPPRHDQPRLIFAVLQNVFAAAAPIRGRASGRLSASLVPALDRSPTPPPPPSELPGRRILAPQTPDSMPPSIAQPSPNVSFSSMPLPTQPPVQPLSTYERYQIDRYLEDQLSFSRPTPLVPAGLEDDRHDCWLLDEAERSFPPPEPDDDIIAALTPTPVVAPQPSLSPLHTSQMTNIAGPCLVLRCPRA